MTSSIGCCVMLPLAVTIATAWSAGRTARERLQAEAERTYRARVAVRRHEGDMPRLDAVGAQVAEVAATMAARTRGAHGQCPPRAAAVQLHGENFTTACAT